MNKLLRYGLLVCLCSLFLNGYAQWCEQLYSAHSYYDYTDYAAFNQAIDASGYDAELLEAAIFHETNRQRVKYGLAPLKYDYNLMVCAHNHSVNMVQYDFFSHISPVPGKYSLGDRVKEVGYVNCGSAENIAEFPIQSTYAESARYVVAELWMNSPGHQKNILNGKYTYLGSGAAYFVKSSTVYVRATQNFLQK